MNADRACRVALVTGAAGGLGSSVARGFAERGYALGLVDVRSEDLDALVDELGTRRDGIVGVAADLGQADECESVVPKIVELLGRVDILVNAAAVLVRRDFEELTAEDFDRVFHTNARSVVILCRAAMKDMRLRRWGRIINITSTGVYEGGWNLTSLLYESSKGAVAVLSKMLARSGAKDGILVNTVCPGGMRTRMLVDETPAEIVQRFEREVIPLGRLADPREVASIIAWLASDEASYATGAEFDVTGGLAIH